MFILELFEFFKKMFFVLKEEYRVIQLLRLFDLIIKPIDERGNIEVLIVN